MRETIVVADSSGDTVSLEVEIIARFDLVIEDDAWTLPTIRKVSVCPKCQGGYTKLSGGQVPTFRGSVIITKIGHTPYVRMSPDGFYRKMDRIGPIQVQVSKQQEG